MNIPPFLRLFTLWYVIDRPRAIVRLYREYACVTAEMFSFVFLLRTLLKPWKNIQDEYPNRGFQLSRILETWTFNTVTRMIGAVIRLGAILVGVIAQGLLFAGFLGYLLAWLAFPLLAILGLLFLAGLLS